MAVFILIYVLKSTKITGSWHNLARADQTKLHSATAGLTISSIHLIGINPFTLIF